MHVVAVGTSYATADRAAVVLERWTTRGAGPVVPPTTRPDIREEIDRVEMALKMATEFLLEANGLGRARASLEALRALPMGTPATTPTTTTPTDVEEEIDRLETAIKAGDHTIVLEAGGSHVIGARLEELRELPDSRTTTARAAIDRFSIWTTTRLLSP